MPDNSKDCQNCQFYTNRHKIDLPTAAALFKHFQSEHLNGNLTEEQFELYTRSVAEDLEPRAKDAYLKNINGAF